MSIVIQKVDTLYVDESSVIYIKLSATEKYKNLLLNIRRSGTIICSVSVPELNDGYYQQSFSLTSTQQDTIMGAMTNTNIMSADYGFTKNGTSVSNSVSGNIVVSAKISQPNFASFSVQETASAVSALDIGYNFIQGQSKIKVTCLGVSGRNQATISDYKAKAGEATATSQTSEITFTDTLNLSGRVPITARVTDSRGLCTERNSSLNVIPYNSVKLSGYSVSRDSTTPANIKLSLSGAFSSIKVNNTEKNELTVSYRYKPSQGGSYSEWTTIPDIVVDGEDFTYTDNCITELSASESYLFFIKASDKLTTVERMVYISGSIPTVSVRSGRVGINKNSPDSELDVEGKIMMNGYYVSGYIGALASSTDLNTLTQGGNYTTPNASTALHYPSASADLLEVVSFGASCIQRITDFTNGLLYIRKYSSGSWSEWKSISMT